MLRIGNRMAVPYLRTPVPGPQARRVIEEDQRYASPSYSRVYPLVVKRGYGAVIEDVDGNLFLDFTAGIAVCSTGHCHPRIVRAIQRQAEQLIHMSGTDFYYQPQRDLAEKLARIAPGSEGKRVFFTNSGAEAVEAAIKLARHHTGRQYILAFHGSFHGRTMGALSLTASKVIQRRGFGPLLPQVIHTGYGNCYRCPYGRQYRDCEIDCIRYIERVVFGQLVAPDEVAAVVVEPIQGEGGYIVPPPEFHPQLKQLAERYGILYVADEVQTGMGRTGRMFACEHWGVVPDILCLAKGIASGMPLGAIVARESVMSWPPGSHASTFGGNPISCAAALETIHLLEEGLIDSAARQGEYLLQQLQDLGRSFPIIGDVRGKGLMLAVDLVADRQTHRPAVAARDALIQRAFHKGLLLLSCGESAVRFCPPLIIDPKQIDMAIQILRCALTDVYQDVPVCRQVPSSL